MTVRQVVITRFSVPITNGGGRHLDEEWLHSRISLFSQYCAPSMQRQTVRDFDWLVLADAKAPGFVIDGIKSAVGSINLQIVRFGAEQPWHDALRERICGLIRAKQLLVSTRLDSDDLLAPHYLQTVRDHARPGENVIMLNGGRFDLERRRLVEVSKFAFENLCSVDGRHVHEFEHSSVRSHYPSTVGTDRLSWIQLIHDGNLANRSMRGRPLRSAGVLTPSLIDPRAPTVREHLSYLVDSGAQTQRRVRSRLERWRRSLHTVLKQSDGVHSTTSTSPSDPVSDHGR